MEQNGMMLQRRPRRAATQTHIQLHFFPPSAPHPQPLRLQTIARLLITGRDALVKIQDKMAAKQAVRVPLRLLCPAAALTPVPVAGGRGRSVEEQGCGTRAQRFPLRSLTRLPRSSAEAKGFHLRRAI
jgi:hypothetical protein